MDSKTSFKTGLVVRTYMPTFRRRLLHGRTANFNSSEKRVLVQLVEPYKDVVDSKRNDVSTVKEKENIWNHVTSLFNAKFTDQKPREPRNLQRLWKNIKSKARAQNTEIDTMLDSEITVQDFMHPIKIEEPASDYMDNGIQEKDGKDSPISEASAGLSLSSGSNEKHAEVFNSFRKIAPKPSLELPTLVQMSQGNDEKQDSLASSQNGKVISTNTLFSNEEAISRDMIRNGSHLPVTAAIGDEYNKSDLHELQYENDSLAYKGEYDANILLMRQAEHEQKMKNLRFERELKREEHAVRMDLLKEETELVRLRKELLKRQLDSYISSINA